MVAEQSAKGGKALKRDFVVDSSQSFDHAGAQVCDCPLPAC
jgi:hypothetical protein